MHMIKYFLSCWILYAATVLHVGVCYAHYLQDVSINVYFSPRGGAQEAILDAIENADQTIYVMAYSFTAEPIVQGLMEAHERGVDVIVIVDSSQVTRKVKQGEGLLCVLAASGVPIYVDSAHAIAHNKVIIIDDYRVITGSYNFSKAAEERNAENTIIIDNQELAEDYVQNFNRHLDHAVIFSSSDFPL